MGKVDRQFAEMKRGSAKAAKLLAQAFGGERSVSSWGKGYGCGEKCFLI